MHWETFHFLFFGSFYLVGAGVPSPPPLLIGHCQGQVQGQPKVTIRCNQRAPMFLWSIITQGLSLMRTTYTPATKNFYRGSFGALSNTQIENPARPVDTSHLRPFDCLMSMVGADQLKIGEA